MTDPHAYAGAYALDAVTEAERAEFAAHLASCAECRDQVREFRETTARLAAAEQVSLRPSLKLDTLKVVQRTSQLGPVTRQRRAAGAGEARGRRWLRTTAARVSVAAAAALIGGVATLGVIAHGQAMRLRQSQREGLLITAVLSSPDRVMLTARVSTGGTATVVMSHRRRALVFTAHGLRPLPGSEGYELWLMGPGGERPAGMLAVRAGGMAGPAVVSGLAPADMIGVSIEPATGSARPTTPLIVTLGGAAP